VEANFLDRQNESITDSKFEYKEGPILLEANSTLDFPPVFCSDLVTPPIPPSSPCSLHLRIYWCRFQNVFDSFIPLPQASWLILEGGLPSCTPLAKCRPTANHRLPLSLPFFSWGTRQHTQ